jgi:hypothetical protein
MTVEKTSEHQNAEAAFTEAKERLATARQNHATGNAEFATAKAERDRLLAASASGAGVTAEAVKGVEDKLRDAESRLAFHKAALDGAQAAHDKAREALRPLERVWFKARHQALHGRRAALAREADDALNLAKQKLAEIDAFRDEYRALQSEANTSPCAPHGSGVTFTQDFLPVPVDGASLKIEIRNRVGMSGHTYGNFSYALGHGSAA